MKIRAFAGSDVDGLSEDLSDEMECDPLTPTIEIEKSVLDVCEGQTTTVTITVHNTSPVVLDPVVITDELPADFSYAGNVTGIENPTLSVNTLTFPDITLEP
ncbi:MAG: DUF11 domain-containing protein, partial [bacterium]